MNGREEERISFEIERERERETVGEREGEKERERERKRESTVQGNLSKPSQNSFIIVRAHEHSTV